VDPAGGKVKKLRPSLPQASKQAFLLQNDHSKTKKTVKSVTYVDNDTLLSKYDKYKTKILY
jgi:hypothetical protein